MKKSHNESDVMRIGYVTVSNRIMIDGQSIGYLYREEPDNEDDSGWRIFAGDETQDYADDASNFALYNASTILGRDSKLSEILGISYPVTYERDSETGQLVRVDPLAE